MCQVESQPNMKSNVRNFDLPGLSQSEEEFLPTHPFDLRDSLKIRDGLMEAPGKIAPRHLLRTIDTLSLRDPNLSLN